MAGPPAKNQGTSLPIWAPSAASRSVDQSIPHTSAAALMTAAASLDPPPSPAPEGICLTRTMSRPRSTPASAARSRAARTTRFVSSAGTSRRNTAPAACASLPPNWTESRMPGVSRAPTTSLSARDTGTISDSMAWNRSGRRARTASERLSLAGAETSTAAADWPRRSPEPNIVPAESSSTGGLPARHTRGQSRPQSPKAGRAPRLAGLPTVRRNYPAHAARVNHQRGQSPGAGVSTLEERAFGG